MGSMRLLSSIRRSGAGGRCAGAVLAQHPAPQVPAVVITASRHSSSLPPPPPAATAASLPVDYHLPFGNPSLLIPTPLSRDATSAALPSTASAPQQPTVAFSTRRSQASSYPPGEPRRLGPEEDNPKQARPAGDDHARHPMPPGTGRPLRHPRAAPRAAVRTDDAPRDIAAEIAAVAEDVAPEAAVREEPLDQIYVLGGNQQAAYLAHLLSGLPQTPAVRMLLLSHLFAKRWHQEGGKVRVLRGGQLLATNPVVGQYVRKSDSAGGFVRRRGWRRARPQEAPLTHIRNLVVTASCVASIQAIDQIKHLIDQHTTICLIQQGLGTAERLNELFFQQPATRPSYILGYMSHELGYTDHAFTVSELKPGNLILSLYTPPAQLQTGLPKSSSAETAAAAEEDDPLSLTNEGEAALNDGMRLMYLLGIAPELGAGGYAMSGFLRRKLPDMIFTAAAESVSTVLDLTQGDALLQNGEARGLFGDLVDEMMQVVLQMPETRSASRLQAFVTSGMLRRQVFRRLYRHGSGATSKRMDVAEGGAAYLSHRLRRPESQCSMALRVANGQQTDIQYLNGYFVRRGKELGVACPMNEMIIRLVQAKRLAASRHIALGMHIPFAASNLARGNGAGDRWSGSEGLPFDASRPGEEPSSRPWAPAAGKFATQWRASAAPQTRQTAQAAGEPREHAAEPSS